MWNQKGNKVKSSFFDIFSLPKTSLKGIYGKFRSIIKDIFKNNSMNSYEIPKVIVIGDESSGKSSLLENITGCPIFPRDTRYCTKIPIKLELKNSNKKINKITYNGKSITVNRDKIQYEIKQLFDSIQEPNNDDIITVEIHDPNLIDFCFYDMPGIIAFPEHKAKRTLQLTEKYIKMDNTIIICVIPSTNTRLTSSQALALVKKNNKLNDTIIALSMVDRLQEHNIKIIKFIRFIS
jgi:GTPase SAR1 family protein